MPSVYTWGLDATQKVKKEQKCCLPKLISFLNDKNIFQVSAGSHCNATLSSDGTVYTWGKAAKGRLGHNNEEDKLVPTKIKDLHGQKITKIACGAWHMGAVTEQGDLFLWGNFSKLTTSFGPKKITQLNGKKVVHLGCGQLWTAVILDNGNLLFIDKYEKVHEFDGAQYTGVWCGSDFGAAVDSVGALWIFGYKIESKVFGPSKPPQFSDFLSPFQIDLSSTNIGRIVQCSCTTGEFHQSIGIVNDQGEVFMWGSNYKGKLGVGDFEDRNIPTRVNLPQRATDLQIGGIHASVITSDKNLFTFGCGSDGRLGHPESKDHRYLFHETSPRLVNALEQRAIHISCSYYHCIAIVD